MQDILVFLCIAIIIALVKCPIKFLTGISCPGCGMTRAVCCVLLGDFKMALHYHPLVFLLIPAAVTYLFRKRLPKKVLYVLCSAAVVLMVVVYFIRLSYPNDVVYINLREGAIYKLLLKIKQLF